MMTWPPRLAPLALSSLLAMPGCGGKQQTPPPTVTKETAEAEVTRIASSWTSTQVDKALLSPPSPVSVRSSTRTSQIELGALEGSEQLVIDEQFELRAGGRVRCHTRFELAVRLKWGRKAGEAAVEITRPAISTARSCDGQSPEALLTEGERRVLFVLNADQLVAIDPPLDERIYRPMSD